MPHADTPTEYQLGMAPYPEIKWPQMERRATQRARSLGAEAALARTGAQTNPYRRMSQYKCFKAWEYMYFKTLNYANKEGSSK